MKRLFSCDYLCSLAWVLIWISSLTISGPFT